MSAFKGTPGPWFWDVAPCGDVRLATPDRGRLFVMGFTRKGMQGAQPRFSLWGEGPRERRGGIMHDFAEAGGEDHPDARLIAAAPELLEALLKLVDSCDDSDGAQYGTLSASFVRGIAAAAIAKATGGAA